MTLGHQSLKAQLEDSKETVRSLESQLNVTKSQLESVREQLKRSVEKAVITDRNTAHAEKFNELNAEIFRHKVHISKLESSAKSITDDQRILRKKLLDLRSSHKTLENQLTSQKIASQRTTGRHIKTIKDLECKLLSQKKLHEEFQTLQQEQFQKDLDSVIQKNKVAVEKQAEMIKNLPDNLVVDSKTISKARETEKQAITEAQRQASNKIKALQRANADEISLLKKQFNDWLNEKDQKLRALTHEFESFKVDSAETKSTMKDEFADIYHYVTELQSLIATVAQEQALRIPSPANILADPTKLVYFKKWIASTNHDRLSKDSDPYRDNRTERARVFAASRPTSAPAAARKPAVSKHRRLDTPRSISHRRRPVSSRAGTRNSSNNNNNSPSTHDMTIKELRMAQMQQQYSEPSSPHHRNTRPKSALARKPVEQQLSEEKLKHRQLRSAYLAQSRQIQQLLQDRDEY